MDHSGPRRLGRSPATVVGTVLALVVLTGCGDSPSPGPVDPDPSPFALADVPLGSEQTAFGTVNDVLSVNSFEVVGALEGGGTLLVLTPDGIGLDDGARVQVIGTVDVLDEQDRSRLGLDEGDLPPGATGTRYLLADSIDAPLGQGDG